VRVAGEAPLRGYAELRSGTRRATVRRCASRRSWRRTRSGRGGSGAGRSISTGGGGRRPRCSRRTRCRLISCRRGSGGLSRGGGGHRIRRV